ncbi:MAG: hypothetical protein AAFY26_11605 [Cyanobacteria bacterium J06638_22]
MVSKIAIRDQIVDGLALDGMIIGSVSGRSRQLSSENGRSLSEDSRFDSADLSESI